MKRCLTGDVEHVSLLLQQRDQISIVFDCILENKTPASLKQRDNLFRSLNKLKVYYTTTFSDRQSSILRLHLQSQPSILGDTLSITFLQSILESPTGLLPKAVLNRLGASACRGAVRFMDKLTDDNCRSMIDDLRYTKDPLRCVHGRRSMFAVEVMPPFE